MMNIYGKNVCYEYLLSNKKVNYIYVAKNFKDERFNKFLSKFSVEVKQKDYLDELVQDSSQGIVMGIPDYNYYSLNDVLKNDSGLLVILDQITDTHNFGAIIRVCESAGVDGLIILKNNSVAVNEKTYKLSAGALANIKIVQVNNLANLIKELKKRNYWVVGSSLDAHNFHYDIDYKMNTALIIGNEEKGIRALTKKQCDLLVKIPMLGHVNSLNASVATGIMIYEIIANRRR